MKNKKNFSSCIVWAVSNSKRIEFYRRDHRYFSQVDAFYKFHNSLQIGVL